MDADNSTKLNRLISGWPRGTVAVSSYLKHQEFSHELLRAYRNSNWIKPVGRGAFILRGDKVDWSGALYALQTQLNLNVHAGGKTALEMKGLTHYISPQRHKVFLYGKNLQKLPAWFKKHSWNGQQIIYSATKLFPDSFDIGLTQFDYSEFFIQISAPERAAMEMLYCVPDRVTFEEAILIMENLVALRTQLVQSLLANCNFVKVKRLFMYMAELHEHPWAYQIDTSKVDFGKGKRLIVKNGILDKKHLITVPGKYREGKT
jgi:hypothetical protein